MSNILHAQYEAANTNSPTCQEDITRLEAAQDYAYQKMIEKFVHAQTNEEVSTMEKENKDMEILCEGVTHVRK